MEGPSRVMCYDVDVAIQPLAPKVEAGDEFFAASANIPSSQADKNQRLRCGDQRFG
jgi:hypothetical protein